MGRDLPTKGILIFRVCLERGLYHCKIQIYLPGKGVHACLERGGELP